MERLFTGRPARTDGELTKYNLWREAGVSRATMYRAVLAERDARAGHSPAGLRDQQRRDEISRLRRHPKDNRKERHRLGHQVDAAATVIATLLAENAALRQQLANRFAMVIPLHGASEVR